MIVWINGAFGAGKTTVAHRLAERLPGAMLFDPEEIGFMLRKVVPAELQTDDFQDLEPWRELTRETIECLVASYGRPVVVPMTVVDSRYFDQIAGLLRTRAHDFYHFTLIASPDTLRQRVLGRGKADPSRDWVLARIEQCVAKLEAPKFARHIPADHRGVDEVVDRILRDLPTTG